MEKVNKKYWIIGIVTTLILAIVGTSYAYWRGAISGVGSKMSFNMGKVYVLFTDNTSLTGEGEVKPGWSVSKTFTIENQGGKDFSYDIYIEDLINTFVVDGGLQYKITSDNNGYNMDDFVDVPRSSEASDVILVEGVLVKAKTKQTYTIEFKYNELGIDQSEDINRNFSGTLAIKENLGKYLYSILSNGIKYEVGTRTDFSTPFGGTTITQGYNQTGKIYLVEDNYYFAGNPSDNWVYFAGFWWRIIRSNSSEGTRLLYAGTSHDGQDGYINNTTYNWNSLKDNPKYVQWDNYASFKSTLNSWYNANITGVNDSMVQSVTYCNDTSVSDASSNTPYFGAYIRLYTNKTPSYSCGINSFGNAAKVGLMTADEVAFAGGVASKESPNTYYYRNSISSGCIRNTYDLCSVTGSNSWWTLSPYRFNGASASMFFVNGARYIGEFTANDIYGSGAVRPVITLKPSVTVSGSGTTDDPYVVVSDGSSSKSEVKVTSNDDNMGTVNPVSQKVSFGSDARVTLNPKNGYVYSSNDCGGIVEDNVMTIKNITDNKECKVTFAVAKSLYATLSDGSKYTVGTRNTAVTTPIEGTSITQGYNSTGKIYKTGNDYYFAGNPSDNWVKFAGFWWRIIRSNSTEGTRLLYAGTSHDGQDGYINDTTYQWYNSYNSANYVQWNYASSTIGNALTTWYDNNITGTNANMVNISVAYCNDTSVARTSGSNQYFGAYGRLVDAKNPSHSCGTNSNSTHRSIGLMTADEVAFAGGVHANNAPNTYYYRNSKSSGCTGSSGDPCSVTKDNYWWTMSPYYCSGTNNYAYVFCVYGADSNPGKLEWARVPYSYAVRPVITLKPEVLISGSGTTSSPYVPSL